MEGHHGEHAGHTEHEEHNMSEHAGHSMTMTFHAGYSETILWTSWQTTSILSFTLSCLGVFVIAFAYEGMKYYRERYYQIISEENAAKAKAATKERNENPEGCCSNSALAREQRTTMQLIFNKAHVLQTLMHMLQLIVSYLLMLVAMIYNYWLFLALIIGAGAGYFCFGWIRQKASDADEHCH